MSRRSVVFTGSLTDSGGLTDSDVAAGAGIAASKLVHEHALNYAQAPGAAIVAATVDLHIVRGATGKTVSMDAVVTGAIATGGDRTVTIDLQRSTAGGAFATVLSSTIVLNNASVLRVAQPAVVNASLSALIVGDILRATVAVAGVAGAQGQGLEVSIRLTEGSAS